MRLTLSTVSKLLQSQKVTSESIAVHCHQLALHGDQSLNLNVFTHLAPKETLLRDARASDDRRRRGISKGPLDGIPVSIKANIAVREYPLTAGSRLLNNSDKSNVGCGYDSDVARRLLRECGAVLIGITNMDEFGMGSLGANAPLIGPTTNPRSFHHTTLTSSPAITSCETSTSMDAALTALRETQTQTELTLHSSTTNSSTPVTRYSAGGSSSGAAASIAHGSSLLALGTDTGGSLRLPAAWCGVVGFKPSYGLISRFGVVSYASSLDTVGLIVGSSRCAALAFNALANRKGGDSETMDSTATYLKEELSIPSTNDNDDCSSPLNGIKIGIPASFSVNECPPCVTRAWTQTAQRLQDAGAQISIVPDDILTPATVKRALAAYYVLASAEASSNLARYDGVRYGTPRHSSSPLLEDGTDMTALVGSLEEQVSSYRARNFGPEVQRRILSGTHVLSSSQFHTHYEAASKLRVLLQREMMRAFQDVDLMLTPTCLSLPLPLPLPVTPGLSDSKNDTELLGLDVMTVPISLANLPSVSIPVRIHNDDHNLTDPENPGSRLEDVIGLQIFGPSMSESLVLRTASIAEHAFPE